MLDQIDLLEKNARNPPEQYLGPFTFPVLRIPCNFFPCGFKTHIADSESYRMQILYK